MWPFPKQKNKPNRKLRHRGLVNMAEDVKRFRHLRSLDDFKPQPISFTEHHYLEFSTLSGKMCRICYSLSLGQYLKDIFVTYLPLKVYSST